MKAVNIMVILAFTISLQCGCQSGLSGVFQYKRGRPLFNETLVLYPNNNFEYVLKMDMGVSLKSKGSWLQKDSFLILDSYPQKEKLIVSEFYKKKQKNISIEVSNKENKLPIYYHLIAILPNNDTIEYRDQFVKTIMKEKPLSFWIVNTVGLRSSEYKIKSLDTNVISILFENNRVFENEDWKIINNNEIQPRSLDGKYYKYFLKKDSSFTGSDK